MRAVGHKPNVNTADTGRLWTKGIWGNIPFDQIQAGEREGWAFHDDFTNMPLLVDSDAGLYASFIDTNATIAQGVANEFGEVILLSDAGDNIGANLCTGGQQGGLANFIVPSTAVPHTIAFEARMKTSTLVGSSFIGFAEEGLVTTTGLLSNTGTLQDKDYIGFVQLEATPTVMDFVYNKESGASPTVAVDDIHTLVADTYVKVGFVYHYKNPASKQIKVYKNGVLNATFVTKTNIADTTNFPGGEEMCLYMGFKNVTDIKNLTVDWWRAALVVNS